MTIDNNGQVELFQSELNLEYDWKNVVGIKGQEMRVGTDRVGTIAVGYANYNEKRKAHLVLIANKGDISVNINNESIIDFKNADNNYYFSKGFIILKAYDNDINIKKFSFNEIKNLSLFLGIYCRHLCLRMEILTSGDFLF